MHDDIDGVAAIDDRAIIDAADVVATVSAIDDAPVADRDGADVTAGRRATAVPIAPLTAKLAANAAQRASRRLDGN